MCLVLEVLKKVILLGSAFLNYRRVHWHRPWTGKCRAVKFSVCSKNMQCHHRTEISEQIRLMNE